MEFNNAQQAQESLATSELKRMNNLKLKKIGRGLGFNVYDLGGTRVFKRPTTRKQKQKLLRSWNPELTEIQINRLAKSAENSATYSQRNLKRHILKSNPEIVGNPIFLKDLKYTQDKVKVLGKFLRGHNLQENKIAIRSYVNCILKQWELGFFQKVTNFTVNFGINKKNEVILIDLDELTFSKKKVAQRVKKKSWLESWSFNFDFKDGELKNYYTDTMNCHLTLDALDRLWKTKR